MGEIGFDRHEFLYDLKFWEIRSIIRGYNARYHAGWEQARFVGYNAHYCMGSKDPVPDVEQWWPFPWEKPDLISQDDIDDIQADIDAMLHKQKQ